MLLHVTKVPTHPLRDDNGGVDVLLEKGGLLWVCGANGRGKTTVLRHLAGYYAQGFLGDVGNRVLVESIPLRIFGLTVAGQLSYYEAMYGMACQWQVDWLDTCMHTQVCELSSGQAQRLSLMRLGFLKRDIWLLDEPANALDSESVQVLKGLVNKHIEAGGGVVFTSHIPLFEGACVLCLD